MFGWLKKRMTANANGKSIKARWDAAQTTTNNQNAWAYADDFSATSAANPDVLRVLRARSRYEFQENNSYGKGMLLAQANFTVGTGPRLEINMPETDVDEVIEQEFARWMKAVGLAEMLRTSRMSKAVDGDTFLVAIDNPKLPTQVQLDFRSYEAEQCSTPEYGKIFDERVEVDGIHFDEYGNPTTYDFLKFHPGSTNVNFTDEYVSVGADRVIHLFRQDRPGQRRGVPETAPALPLMPILRRYTLATLEAATSAAYWMALIHTDAPADTGPAEIQDGDFAAFNLERNAAMSLPEGWKISQLKPEHPTTTYGDFKKEILEEIARCLEIPFNIASGNSSDYNFASGRLDWQSFFRSVEVERQYYERVCLDRIFYMWLDEALLIPGYLPPLGNVSEVPHAWHWDGFPVVDPTKEANAAVNLAGAGLLDEDAYWQEKGLSVEEAHRRMARAEESRENNDLPPLGGNPEPSPDTQSEEEPDEAESESEEEVSSPASDE